MAGRKRKGKENTEMCSPNCGKRLLVTQHCARLCVPQLSVLLSSHHTGGRAVTVRTPGCPCPRALWPGTRDGKGGGHVPHPQARCACSPALGHPSAQWLSQPLSAPGSSLVKCRSFS